MRRRREPGRAARVFGDRNPRWPVRSAGGLLLRFPRPARHIPQSPRRPGLLRPRRWMRPLRLRSGVDRAAQSGICGRLLHVRRTAIPREHRSVRSFFGGSHALERQGERVESPARRSTRRHVFGSGDSSVHAAWAWGCLATAIGAPFERRVQRLVARVRSLRANRRRRPGGTGAGHGRQFVASIERMRAVGWICASALLAFAANDLRPQVNAELRSRPAGASGAHLPGQRRQPFSPVTRRGEILILGCPKQAGANLACQHRQSYRRRQRLSAYRPEEPNPPVPRAESANSPSTHSTVS